MPAAAHDQLKIVASFSILGDMVRQVAGDEAEVTTIVGPDGRPRLYAQCRRRQSGGQRRRDLR